jgi:hypothetical protein
LRRVALYLDASPGFVGSVRPMFGGGLCVLELDGVMGELVLRRFPSARVDARGFVEDLPASFRVF